MKLHHFVGSGFPRTTCAICGGPVLDKRHHRTNDLRSEELARERQRSAARQRRLLDKPGPRQEGRR